MPATTLLVYVRSNCEVGEKHDRFFWFRVDEAPAEIFVGDTVHFSNGAFVTIESRSWRRANTDRYLVVSCSIGAIPFNEFFRSGEKITETGNEVHVNNIKW
jgi:hypothetical protein